MKRLFLLFLLLGLLAIVGCGGSTTTPPTITGDMRPLPGGKKPDSGKTAWDQSGNTKPKR